MGHMQIITPASLSSIKRYYHRGTRSRNRSEWRPRTTIIAILTQQIIAIATFASSLSLMQKIPLLHDSLSFMWWYLFQQAFSLHESIFSSTI